MNLQKVNSSSEILKYKLALFTGYSEDSDEAESHDASNTPAETELGTKELSTSIDLHLLFRKSSDAANSP